MSQISHPRQITVAEMSPHVHSFVSGENKVNKLSDWLIQWIKKSLHSGSIKPFDLLPAKGELAFHIGVSKGTIQNVFRFVEDCGYVESRQKIGTYIKNPDEQASEKLTSKRELAAEEIKKYILKNGFKEGDYLISTRKLSEITGMSNTTVRIAIGSLISENIIKKENHGFLINKTDFRINNIKTQTLVEKTSESIKQYITANISSGSKLPANFELAEMFNVSVKTIHDSLKLLSKEGIIQTRRGQYGTVFANGNELDPLYHYEKIEMKLRHFISEKCEVGIKLPSILEFSKMYEVSAKTVKKALDNLAEEGYITYARGRYGGTFVTDIPPALNEAYKWLALTPGYLQNSQN